MKQNNMPSSSTSINGYVYKLFHPRRPTLCYVGSSSEPVEKRIACHISHAIIGDSLINTAMLLSEERASWVIEKLEEGEYPSREDLYAREEHWRLELDAKLNTKRCHVVTPPDVRERQRQRQRSYYQNALESRLYRCETCDHTAFTNDGLVKHLKSKKHLKRVEGVASKSVKDKESGKYRCEICKKNLCRQSSLNCHLKSKKHLANLKEWETK